MVLPNLPDDDQRLREILTPAELEQLGQAFRAILQLGNGWGEIVVKIKAGRIDTLEILSSILVRDKNS
jgi:hypothetical protein